MTNLLPLLILLTNLLLLPTHAANPSPGCGNSTPRTPTDTAITLTVNNKQRQYFVRLPTPYNATHPYRLIFTLHALGGSAADVIAGTGGYLPYYGLPPLANETAIFIAPNGLNRGWANQGGEDIQLVDAILAAVEADLCVDRNLRFSTGFSFGGAMSHSIACSRAKEFRAVAVCSSGPLSGCVGGSDPIAYYGQHGISDNVLTIAQGRGLRDRFVRNNGCAGGGAGQERAAPARGSGVHVETVFEGCKEGFPVKWITFDGDHMPFPKDANQADSWTPGEVWEFFSQF